jgi:hypothetical protein
LKRCVYFTALLLLIPVGCLAKTFYLDNSPGIVNGSNSYSPSTRTVGSGTNLVYNDVYVASQSLVNGDTLYIRSGEYYSDVRSKAGYSWTWGSLHVQASNTLIKNYNSEIVWIKGGASRTSVTSHTNNATDVGGTGNTIDGINFYGCAIISGTSTIFQNCDFSGGWDHQSPIGSDAWYDVIRFESGVNTIVRNSRIHDNYNHGTTTAAANKALIMHERDQNTIVENCEFYNAVSIAVYAKYQSTSGTIHATYRYNFFRNAGGIDGPNSYQGKELHVYQNVFLVAGGFYRDGLDSLKFKIYNNTFYNANDTYASWTGASAWDSFNNIFFANNVAMRVINLDGTSWAGGSHDYNDYYKAGGSFSWYTNATDTSLSGFRSRTGQDSHSVETTPGFLNASGQFNTPSDFKRPSYPTNGRGGTWPAVMGAYITGNEVIGVSNVPLPPPPPPPPPPGTPQSPSATPGDTLVTVSCGTVSGATGYNIYWSTISGVTPGTGTKISNISVPFVHVNLTNGTTYYYVITAVNAGGESGPSVQVSATPVHVVTNLVPNPPSTLSIN